MAISTVSLKIPPFWPADPLVWFAQVEAQFATRNITAQKTKFDYIIASLTPEFATEVRDLILSPPADTPFDILKDQLVKRTAASEQRRLQQLFVTEELGDRQPTQLLRRMNQLLGDKASGIDNSLLRELFLQRLPPNVRMVLASTAEPVTLEALASLADKIMEVATPTVSTINHSSDHLLSELSSLKAELSQLKQLITSRNPSHRPSRSRPNSPARPRSNTPQPSSDLCWYHQHFGSNAQKCRSPCSFPGNDQASH